MRKYPANPPHTIQVLRTRNAELDAALDWVAQQLRNIVTNKSVDDWQEAMIQLADYIDARKAP
jgi:hypothetical protein